MALVFPNVVRYSIVGGLQNELCVNILDVRITDEFPAGSTRDEVIYEVAGDLLNQWDDHILPNVTWAYQAEEVRWVDLDTAAGSTGARTSTDGATWPAVGGQQVATLPNNTYVKMKKVLEGKNRQQRAGLLRLGGLAETSTQANSPNVLTTQHVTALNAAFESLKDGINGLYDGSVVNLGVLHTVDNVATGFSEIAEFSAQSTVGTIRRRMPGYGQ